MRVTAVTLFKADIPLKDRSASRDEFLKNPPPAEWDGVWRMTSK